MILQLRCKIGQFVCGLPTRAKFSPAEGSAPCRALKIIEAAILQGEAVLASPPVRLVPAPPPEPPGAAVAPGPGPLSLGIRAARPVGFVS